MLNTRNVVAVTIVVMVVSLLAAILALSQPPTSGGLGIDSYGTRGLGFRGLLETLEALDVPVERSVTPPDRSIVEHATVAFLEPSPELIATESAYLQGVADWVRNGGSVVVATSGRQISRALRLMMNTPSKGILADLGLPEVGVEVVGSIPISDDSENIEREPFGTQAKHTFEDMIRPLEISQTELRVRTLHATVEGNLASRFPHGLDLVLPADFAHVLNDAGPKPAGRIRAVLEPEGKPRTLAAVYSVGRGTIAVIAEPRLAQNLFIAKGDNAVLACHLLTDLGRPAIFDEFYHGLTVRGQPLWLLSRFPYGLLAATVLAASLIVGWRATRFLGPPLHHRETSRRRLDEYIDAMARLLIRSRNPAPFVMKEIRNGLLWRMRHEFGLSPGTDDGDRIARVVGRRDPELANRLRDALTSIDASVASGKFRTKDLEPVLKKVSLCVRRRAIPVGP